MTGIPADPKRFASQGPEFKTWREQVDTTPLARLTSEAIQQWKLQYLSQHKGSPEKHGRAVNTVNAHLRNARSLSTPKALEFAGKRLALPDPLPFASVTLERKRGTTRYVSRIDPAVLVRQAKEELGDDPARQEQFKIFCLALLCGLRKREIDTLLWRSVDLGNRGTIFKITTAGVLTTLHNFSAVDANGFNADGANPVSALVQSNDGSYYGTASAGGSGASGTVFKITSGGSLMTLHNFSALSGTKTNGDGAGPYAALLLGHDGNFYGTTNVGGANGTGTTFKITPGGMFTLLHTFSAVDANGKNADGNVPAGTLIENANGVFYGTAFRGGTSAAGTVFTMTFPPVVTSATTAAATVGKAFSYQITASGKPPGRTH